VSDQHLADRALRWANRRRHRLFGRNPWVVTVDVIRNSVEDRLGGLAAEMAFWALLSLFPLLVTIAALLGYAERIVGAEELRRGQEAIIGAGSVVFSSDLTSDVVRPLVAGLLREGRGGVAITGLLVALYLASRVFTATIRALDLAYRVPERRGLVRQRVIAMGFAAGFVALVVVALLVVVVGPLLGAGEGVADDMGMGSVFEVAWQIARWPVLVAGMIAFLSAVYLWGPNVRNTFRECLPGAILGVATWAIASFALRFYLIAGGGQAPILDGQDQAVELVGRVIGTLIAVVLWTYVTGLAILLGGELNGELHRLDAAEAHGVRAPAPSETMRASDSGGV
jgi:membrane protein